MKKRIKQACAFIQAAVFSLMCLNGAAVTYADNIEIVTDDDENIKPISIYMVETPSATGEVAVEFVDEYGNEIDFDLSPDIDMADNFGSYYNLYDEGRATSVKDQGMEGLCWAHAGMSAVESNLVTQNIEPLSVDLSEKHMAWFTNGVGPSDENDPLYGDIGKEYGTGAYDQGGHIYGFTATLARGSGPVYESLVPYSTKTALSEDLRYLSLYQLEDMTLFDPSDRTSIKKALVENGVVYLNYRSDNTYLNRSVYAYYCPNALTTNHAVSIVGWDDNFSKDNFNTAPEGDGAWIIKNSWGTDWGNDGLFYLSYYDATVKTVGTFSMSKTDSSSNIYQYDGNYAFSSYYGERGFSLSNIFTSDSDERLDAVSFWTTAAEIPYKISVYTDIPEGGNPTSGTLVHTQQGEMTYAGYHKVDLTESIDLGKGCRYSIVLDLLKLNAAAVADTYSPSAGLSFCAAYNLSTGKRSSWSDTGTSYNVCLKAFTSESAGLPINSNSFPDTKFRQYVSDNIDTDYNGYLSQSELDAVTRIDVSGTVSAPNSIERLDGIEYFANLKELNCNYNRLTSLDLSSNTALTSLSCTGNTYSIGDVEGSYSLDDLPAGFDPAKASGWTGASYDSAANLLADFTSSAVTYTYDCGNGHSASFTLTASSYKNDPAVNEDTFPDATFRQYVSDNIDKDNNGRLSQTERDAVTSINLSGTSSAYNTVADLTGIGYFTKLKMLRCGYNQITSLDLSDNTALQDLYCHNNQLTSLNVTSNTALKSLYCYNNQLESIDVSKNTVLEILSCANNQLTSLGLSENTALTSLYCNNNKLTSLDTSNNTALKTISCNENQLESLVLSNGTALTTLSCYKNKLTKLDVSKNTELDSLSCYSNQLTGIDVKSNTKLTSLRVNDNQLTSLDVSNNKALKYLYCYDNQLTSLDVSKNTALKYLYCSNNQLTSLDISNITGLSGLSCYDNTYNIGGVSGSYSLDKLPAGFDAAKASSWSGATYDPETNSLKDLTSNKITYKYNCGNSKTVTFTLTYTSVYISKITVASDKVVITYSDNSTLSFAFDEVPEELVDVMLLYDINVCIDFVNAFSGKEDTQILTAAQLKAIEAVLANDNVIA